MMLSWQASGLRPEHLSLWESASTSDEKISMQTRVLLEPLSGVWLSEKEEDCLISLLERGGCSLVWRYLDLQLFLRKKGDPLSLQKALALESALEGGQKDALMNEVGFRSIERVLFRLVYPYVPKPLRQSDLSRSAEEFLEEALSAHLPTHLFIEEFLKIYRSSFDPLDYLARFCLHLEELYLWEDTLNDLREDIEQIQEETSLEWLPFFEKQLAAFHRMVGQVFFTEIHPLFGEVGQAYSLGIVKAAFTRVNDAYGAVKSRMLSEPVDMHLTCFCHFAENLDGDYPINNRVIPLKKTGHITAQSQKSVLIFTCGGGKGHISATKAIGECSEGHFHIHIANTLEDTLAPSDVLKKLLLDFSQEKLYNHLLKNEEFEWLRLLTTIGPFFLMMQQETIQKLIRLEVLRIRPDFIISAFPILNPMFLNVAKELDIPLLMVTTDLDTGPFVRGMNTNSCPLDYPKYRMTLAYDSPKMRSIIEKRISKDKIKVTGFPLRKRFLHRQTQDEKQALRKQLRIQEDHRVILLMIGGNAGKATEKYAELFATYEPGEIEEKYHVLILCGDQKIRTNRQMLKKIKTLTPLSSNILLHPLPAQENVADLMQITDAFITKPGGCSTNEALALNLPMIFHSPFALMEWEQFNMQFCLDLQMGFSFKIGSQDRLELLNLIKKAISKRDELTAHPLNLMPHHFPTEFLKVVNELLP